MLRVKKIGTNMRYNYIKLVNFKYFPFADSDVFEQRLDEKVTIISGMNGTGKSSLLSELTPMPADKNMFYKGGYKEIHISHNGDNYVLISDFSSSSPVFNFLKNEEELNASNNVTTQKELAYKCFGITQVIQDLLTGKETFTNMGLLARKKLFNSISHLNIDSVLDSHAATKEQLKQKELALSLHASLRQSEEKKLIPKDSIKTIEDSIESCKIHIDDLLRMRDHLVKNTSDKDSYKGFSDLDELTTRLAKLKGIYWGVFTLFPEYDISRKETTLSMKIHLADSVLQNMYSSLDKNTKLLDKIKAAGDSDSSLLKERISTLETSLVNRTNCLTYLKHTPDEKTKSDVYRAETVLPELLYAIKTNSDRHYSTANYDKLTTEKNSLAKRVSDIVIREGQVRAELSHLASHEDDIVCPNCEHSWSPSNYREKKKSLMEESDRLLSEKINLQSRLDDIGKTITDYDEYFFNYRTYISVKKATIDSLSSFWEHLDSAGLIFNEPKTIVTEISKLNMDLSLHDEISSLTREIAMSKEKLDVLIEIGTSNSKTAQITIDELLESIQNLQTCKLESRRSLSMLETAKKVYAEIARLEKAIETAKNDLQEANLSYVASNCITVIDDELRASKVSLIDLERQISSQGYVNSTIDSYTKTMDDITIDIKLLNAILDELCPKKGIIARKITSLLNVIIGNVNSTLNSLWNYSMTLKVIDMETEALNYKFKLDVEGKLEVADVSLASAGMRKVINFAFVCVLYKLLGLSDYPLYLDEFSVNLDSAHVQRFTQIINQIAMSDKHSQVFVISHINNDSCFTSGSVKHIELG